MHVTVYQERGVFAGWPANHGAWQWGDEFLVGFIRGEYNVGGMHNVAGHLEKVQARSLDGGLTWSVEVPRVDFECRRYTGQAPPFSLQDSIIRVCGRYDHGGEDCKEAGGFYLSRDRGKTWTGAFPFTGLEPPRANQLIARQVCTARTRTLGDLVFLSARLKRHWGSDWIYCAEHDGGKFRFKSMICDDEYRAVMPAVARTGERLIVTARRRGAPRVGGWIDAFVSDDEGQSWRRTAEVAETGQDNGNPPALIEHNGMLYCAYANRTMQWVAVSISEDAGLSWTGYKTLRVGQESDIGYPQLFKRADGKLVCVYYWAEDPEDHQHIEATIFDTLP